MYQFYNVLKSTKLFKSFSDTELPVILDCLNARLAVFDKKQIIREEETFVSEVGIVVRGVVLISKIDYNGNRTILAELNIGETFGESLAFSDANNSPITIIAAEKTSVIFISAKKILEGCSSSCSYHSTLTKNLISLLAQKILTIQMKNDILSQKTTREKLLLYFEYGSKTANNKTFRIHFSRAELADFLSINSSAMSRELGKMRDEGILSFHKNKFVLKKREDNPK